MGCLKKVRLTDDPNEAPYWDLPQPLAPGAPRRIAADGTTTLYTPNWSEAVTAPENVAFVDAAVGQMLERHKSGGHYTEIHCW